MTTKQTKPASKASKPASKAGKPDPIAEMQAKLEALEAQNRALEAEKQALADRLKPRTGNKQAFYESHERGTAPAIGATGKGVLYPTLSPAGTLEIARLALKVFGINGRWTAGQIAPFILEMDRSSTGAPKYNGKDPLTSARINGWQRARNNVMANPALAPFKQVGKDGRSDVWALDLDKLKALEAYIESGHYTWPNS